MSKKKFYAVKTTGQIFDSWDKCKSIVNGLSGARYKSFRSLEEAQTYLKGDARPALDVSGLEVVPYVNDMGISGTITIADEIDPFILDLKGAVYAVDGSFNEETGVYGAGIARYNPSGKVLNLFRVSGSRPELAVSRNVAGEVLAFSTAIARAVEQSHVELTIICDYEGIYRWTAPKSVEVSGKSCWGVSDSSAIASYLRTALNYAVDGGIETINFVWVRGHRGVHSNELVDKLAKSACGLAQ